MCLNVFPRGTVLDTERFLSLDASTAGDTVCPLHSVHRGSFQQTLYCRQLRLVVLKWRAASHTVPALPGRGGSHWLRLQVVCSTQSAKLWSGVYHH